MGLSDSWANRQPKTARMGAAEAVLVDLRTDIESGDLPVGTKLPAESALAARYGVSRSVVREALRSSTALGLTETHTGKGTFVIADRAKSDLTFGTYSASELREARPHIEVPAAGLAALRRTDEQLARLIALADSMDAEKDPVAWVRLDGIFHRTIAEASSNTVFASVLSEIGDALSQQSSAINTLPQRQQTSTIEHRALVDAIASGSYDAAARAMADHLRTVEDSLVALLSSTRAQPPSQAVESKARRKTR